MCPTPGHALQRPTMCDVLGLCVATAPGSNRSKPGSWEVPKSVVYFPERIRCKNLTWSILKQTSSSLFFEWAGLSWTFYLHYSYSKHETYKLFELQDLLKHSRADHSVSLFAFSILLLFRVKIPWWYKQIYSHLIRLTCLTPQKTRSSHWMVGKSSERQLQSMGHPLWYTCHVDPPQGCVIFPYFPSHTPNTSLKATYWHDFRCFSWCRWKETILTVLFSKTTGNVFSGSSHRMEFINHLWHIMLPVRTLP